MFSQALRPRCQSYSKTPGELAASVQDSDLSENAPPEVKFDAQLNAALDFRLISPMCVCTLKVGAHIGEFRAMRDRRCVGRNASLNTLERYSLVLVISVGQIAKAMML